MKKLKEFLVGTSFMWLPILLIAIANQLSILLGLGSL